MSIEDVDGDIFRSGRGIYLNYRHYVEMEKNNPNGMGDYPRRMIVLKEKTDEQKKKRRQGNSKPNQNNDNRGQR